MELKSKRGEKREGKTKEHRGRTGNNSEEQDWLLPPVPPDEDSWRNDEGRRKWMAPWESPRLVPPTPTKKGKEEAKVL